VYKEAVDETKEVKEKLSGVLEEFRESCEEIRRGIEVKNEVKDYVVQGIVDSINGFMMMQTKEVFRGLERMHENLDARKRDVKELEKGMDE
jgi:hypothetical protein